ncbi:MAG TPA: hypothetical protein VMH87_15240 [Pseudomonadales bacterium]|nr:hypothetical protein [Pseudomonadales bacterium]
MKTIMKVAFTVLALSAAGFMAHAQDNGGPPDGGQPGDGPPPGQGFHHRPPPLPLAQALDVNHDGVIDSNEIANASAELLTLDKNGDGVLTTNEYLPPRPKNAGSMGQGFRPPPSPLVEALDVNQDGVIDANEIANAPAELLTLDKNGDGQLTPNEYRPHRPPGPPPGSDDSSNDGPPGPPPGGDMPDGGPPGPPSDQ